MLSVIIVNYQSGPCVAEAVRHCLSSEQVQQCIVVDNASSDNSASTLPVDSRVKVELLDRNLGFAKAANLGAKQVTQPHILLLNPDAVVGGEALEAMVALMQTDARIGMVGAWVCDPDGSEQRGTRRRLPTPWRAIASLSGVERLLGRRCRVFRGVNENYGPRPRCAHSAEAVSGACMLVRRSAFESIGGFDEGFFLHCEDLDLFKRLQDAGFQILLQPEAKVSHHQGVSSRAVPALVLREKHQSMKRYVRKHARSAPERIVWEALVLVDRLRLAYQLAWQRLQRNARSRRQ